MSSTPQHPSGDTSPPTPPDPGTARTPSDVDHVPPDCADEPIRVPGSVQPHGVLLGLTGAGPDATPVVVSDSCRRHLGRAPEDLLGVPIGDVVGAEAALDLTDGETGPDPVPVEIDVPDAARRLTERRAFTALTHRVDDLLVVELEPCADEPANLGRRSRAALRALQTAQTVEDLTAVLAREIRVITGFERVMVYRFDRDWNGEVVAEDRADGLTPYLGLHFPADDIPAQARELYASQWLRSIPDARYEPSPLVPDRVPATGAPLDLSGASLRSVSPVHLRYLANMGVRASMSVSLLVHGRLWGLVACHHESGPHHPSPTVRSTAEFLGRTASVLLQARADEARYVDSVSVGNAITDLTRSVADDVRNPLDALDDTLLDVMSGTTGAAVRIDGVLRLHGVTPSADDVDALARAIWPDHGRPFVSHALGRDLPGHAVVDRVSDVASGVLAVRLTALGGEDFVMWFRPEVLREVVWAGDPHAKTATLTPEGPRLHPRASFARWVERVRGTATPWRPAQAAAAESLAKEVDVILARRKAEDERVVAAMQRIVLSEDHPMPPGYALARRFEPSGSDVLGGDWYDATQMPDGRSVLMVGDIAGHGMGVAAITAQVRNALRAYLVNEGRADVALARTSELVATLLPGELATVVAAELDATSGEVEVSRAGHPPALHVHAAGAEYVAADVHGPALGIRTGAPGVPRATVRLAPGDCLVLFTDGLVETREHGLEADLERLRARAEAIGPDRDALLTGLLRIAPDNGDDVTLLVLQRTP